MTEALPFPCATYTNYEAPNLKGVQRYYAYNVLDCCITRGVYDTLHTELDAHSQLVYDFERRMQKVAFTMQLRGIAVDIVKLGYALKEVDRILERIAYITNKLATVVWGRGLNPASSQQKKMLIYEVLGIPPVYAQDGHVTLNYDTMIALSRKYPQARLILRCCIRHSYWAKQASFLRAKLSRDGRMRASFNVGATETGRWSSSHNCFGEGLNFQNVYKKLRNIFVPSKGMKFANLDLRQAESRVFAYLSNDPGYIAAHHSSDTHTFVAKLIWPTAGWPSPEEKCSICAGAGGNCSACGGDGTEEARFARMPNFLRHFSRRDLTKRVQHGTNYGASEFALVHVLGCSLAEARIVREAYLRTFQGITRYQNSVREQLRRNPVLVTPVGRRRQFYDRPWDAGTHRDAIAHTPQSVIGDILNVGLYRVYTEMDDKHLRILHQGHDSFLFEYPANLSAEQEQSLLLRVAELATVQFMISGRQVEIPVDIKTGANWLEACS